eukprot:5944668-Pyramimonas_sp.AAC.1
MVHFPSHNVSLRLVLSTHLAPVLVARADAQKPAYYLYKGVKRYIRNTGKHYNVFFGTGGEHIRPPYSDWTQELRTTGNAACLQNARVVIVSVGH